MTILRRIRFQVFEKSQILDAVMFVIFKSERAVCSGVVTSAKPGRATLSLPLSGNSKEFWLSAH